MRQTAALVFTAALATALILALSRPASAHPLSQGALKVAVFADHLDVEARVPFEEILIAATHQTAQDAPESLPAALRAHGEYLLGHLHFAADGTPLTGKVVQVSQSANVTQPGKDDRIVYTFRYDLAAAPHALQVTQDVLNEIDYAPGNRWEASYVVSFTQDTRGAADGLFLTSQQPVSFNCVWNGAVTAETKPAGAWSTFKAFCHHGIFHILTGYDHLLFITTLVLAAASFWDLFKVVGTFTIAHGLTLTLSVLNIVRLPERVVEPMIAASIIYVALENAFFPQRSRSWTRLGAAFFFGLFHGLGFAGGLLEAMDGMPGVAIAVALIAFSVGVELGHQIVVIPLYSTLRVVRGAQKDEAARQRVFTRIRKFASLAISAAGIFYLAAALGFFTL